MKKIINYLENTPNYIINAITIISFVSMPLSAILQGILIWLGKIQEFQFNILYCVSTIALVLILLAKIKKYHSLLWNRMKVVSSGFSSFLNYSQGVYFDIMKMYKQKKLTLELLRDKYQNELIKILNSLCRVMESYTGREIHACIKIINYNNLDNVIDLDVATVSTLCRSENSAGRGEYENSRDPIYIKRNTDFREIVDSTINTGKPYFYVTNLEKYAENLEKSNRRYENSNENYKAFYKSTIVMPIRIETEKLYHISKEDKFDIIGFLCVDSLSTDAFLPRQEKFNCNIVKAFADNIYVLLGQYSHYMKKFSTEH